MGSSIPKVIHQTYSYRPLPAEIEKNINILKKLNQNWEYRFYDDSDREKYIKKNFPSILKLYQKINPKYGAVRADLFRYLLMYNEGGVYLDIKSSFSKPLDETINPNDKFILTHWGEGEYKGWGDHPEIRNPKGEYIMGLIVIVKGHPLMYTVIENVIQKIKEYDSVIHGVGKKAVLRLTGPIVYTLSIEPLLHLYEHRIIDAFKDMGYRFTIYNKIENHHDIFKVPHYSKLEEPIIKQGLKGKIKSYLFRQLGLRKKNV